MANPTLIVRDPSTGRVRNDASTYAGLNFGILTIGGAGSPQSGTVQDARFAWGEPMAFVLSAQMVGVDGYEPSITINGTTLTWTFPRLGSTASERPVTTILYGVG